MKQGKKMDGERVTGVGDDHAQPVSGHEYVALLFIITTL
jgi:hypothetical protein